jgi:hypothetical protein
MEVASLPMMMKRDGRFAPRFFRTQPPDDADTITL